MNLKKIAAAFGIFIMCGVATGNSPQYTTSSTFIYDIAVSPNGEVVFVADENTIKAYSVSTYQLIREFSGGHQETILSLAVSPDSSLLASVDRNSDLIIRDMKSAEIIKQFNEHQGKTLTLAFSPCGKYLASAGLDNRVILYGMENLAVLSEYEKHTKGVTRVKFSHDGRWLAAAGAEGKILVIDLLEPGRQNILDEPNTFLRDLDFSHCGSRLSAAGNNGRVYTWRIFDPDNFRLLSSDRESRKWITSIQYASDDPIFAFSGFTGRICFNTIFGQYTQNVKAPVHKLILLQKDDSTFSLLVATRGNGVMHIQGNDMHIGKKKQSRVSFAPLPSPKRR